MKRKRLSIICVASCTLFGLSLFWTMPSIGGDFYEAEDMTLNLPMVSLYDALYDLDYITCPDGESRNNDLVWEAHCPLNWAGSDYYYLWVRMRALDPHHDSMYVGITGNAIWGPGIWKDTVYPSQCGTWEWVRVENADGSGDYRFPLAFEDEPFTLVIGHKETGAMVDKVYVVGGYPNEVPNGIEAEDMNLRPGSSMLDSYGYLGEYLYCDPGMLPSNNPPPAPEAHCLLPPLSGPYYLWARVWGRDRNHDALYVGVENGMTGAIKWDRVYPALRGAWEWVRVENGVNSGNYKFDFDPAFPYGLVIGHGETEARVDKFFYTDDPNEVPPKL